MLTTYGSAEEIWVLMAYTQMPPLNAHADLPSEVRCLNFGLSLYLHPCIVYSSSDDFGVSVHMCSIY